MFGLDDVIAQHFHGAVPLVCLLVALVLGLRHATDPDHVVALSTLAVSGKGSGRAGARLGFAWGLGHATTVLLFGVPIVLFRSFLPDVIQRGAEAFVGVIIVALAVRLLHRWHVSRGAHGPHAHDQPRVRTARQAFGIGLAHGTGGSAGVTVLLLASIPQHRLAIASLVVLALGTVASMTGISAVLGRALHVLSPERLLRAVPPMVAVSMAFGVWYGITAWHGSASLLQVASVWLTLVVAFVGAETVRGQRGPATAERE
jgi:sulfite exporter TauE/SafE